MTTRERKQPMPPAPNKEEFKAILTTTDSTTVFADLNTKQQKEFLNYDVVYRNLGEMEPSVIKEIFQRINSTSYSLNAMELTNARYNGEFKQVAEHISKLEFFDTHNIFTP